MDDAIELRVVFFREGPFWLAQGLEFDIGVQAEDLKDLTVRLACMLTVEVQCKRLRHLAPSPKYFHDLWVNRAGLFAPATELIANFPQGLRINFALVA